MVQQSRINSSSTGGYPVILTSRSQLDKFCPKMSDDKYRDVVATWEIALSDGRHRIQFEHGTTTGKRVILVDNVEVIRNNWMFRLVGKESFTVGGKRATINIEAVSGFQYEYTLEVDGKPLKKFVENRKKTAKVWTFLLDGVETRMVLGKLNV